MPHLGRNSAKATVLVVDDSPEIQRYLRTLLELDSYRVETASSGEEALLRLRHTGAPNLALVDLQMPGLDGLETLYRLKELWPALKVIICSGVDDPIKIHEALSLGANAYLLKPVRHLYLSAAVEQCLSPITPKPGLEPAGAQLFVMPSPGQSEQKSVP